jgi:hypothetical protein
MNADTAPREDLPEPAETNVIVVWPSIGAYRIGRFVGRLCGVQLGFGRFFTLGKLFALATIPLSFLVYFWKILPAVGQRYRLTTHRVVIEKGLRGVPSKAVGLEEFDAIDIEVLPGQEFLHAGDLVFRRQGREVFRLPGVSRPAVLREICWKTRTALLSVREVLREQAKGNAA